MHLINTLVKGNGEIRVRFLEHHVHAKADAFLLTAQDENGTEVLLIDGGWQTGETLCDMLKLRREMLAKANLLSEENNADYKMEISLLVSHFHIDHVEAMITEIIPCPYFSVKHVYYPPESELKNNKRYPITHNGDIEHRPRLMAALETYQKQAVHHEYAFAQEETVPFGPGKMRMMMSLDDWGTEALSQYAEKLYFATKPEEVQVKVGIPIVNANCLWMQLIAFDKKVLFTSDTMKRRWDADDEAMDRFMRRHGDSLVSDIVKYPHHGVLRNEAWPNVQKLLKTTDPAHCVVLTGSKGHEESGPYLTENQIPWVDLNDGTVTFSLTEKGLERL